MMRSLYAGVAGLKNHQTRMDVIGNNIANVNTVGFKRGRVNFQEMMVQTLRGASSPQAGRGGVNAMQVGLGVSAGSIDTVQTQGNLQNTGKNTDMAIQGDGYFILSDGSGQYYTRSGTLDVDRDGNLISSSNGYKVLGWSADATGKINTNSSLSSMTIPIGQSMKPLATTSITFANNLDASAQAGITAPHSASIEVYDSQGFAHTVITQFTKTTTDNQWKYKATLATNDPQIQKFLATYYPNFDSMTLDDQTKILDAVQRMIFDGFASVNGMGATTAGVNVLSKTSGLAGNQLSIEFKNNGASLPLDTTVTGTPPAQKITVQLATDAAGKITSTLNDIITDINKKAGNIVIAALDAGIDGNTIAIAEGPIQFTNGNDTNGALASLTGFQPGVNLTARNAGADGNKLKAAIVNNEKTAAVSGLSQYINLTAKKAGAVGNYIDVKLVNNAVAATATGGANATVAFTAKKPGTNGNSIVVDVVDPGALNAGGISVSGTTITVTLPHDGSAVTGTRQWIVDQVNTNPAASALVTATGGSATIASAQTYNLAGGVDGTLTSSVTGTGTSADHKVVTVTLATDGDGNVTSTLNDVMNKINTDPNASQFLTATVVPAANGGNITQVGQVTLAGGADSTFGVTVAGTAPDQTVNVSLGTTTTFGGTNTISSTTTTTLNDVVNGINSSSAASALLIASMDSTAIPTNPATVTGPTALSGGADSSRQGTIIFNNDGTINAEQTRTANGATSPDMTRAFSFQPPSANIMKIMPDFRNITQYTSAFSAVAQKQDGNPTGTLQSFAIDGTGKVSGIFSNGFTKELAVLAIANFNNPGGLIKVGDNMFKRSNNSGLEQIGTAGNGGRGTITPGALEMSNVDLSQEFTDMITTQRGFQSNSRIITTSDEMLQELVNLKR